MNACILTCSSLTEFVAHAQEAMRTAWPVVEADRNLHAEPSAMEEAVLRLIRELPPEYDTVLVSMGFCGGVWDHVTAERRMVIPRVDDCVSLLLQVDDRFIPNRKEPGHLYLYETDPRDFSALTLMRDSSRLDEDLKKVDPELLFHMWFDNYRHMDIIDTGFNDCYSEEYVTAAQANADQINADLDYVPGGNRMLEKLVSGQWDQQFIVAEPGQTILHGDFFG